MVSESLHLSKTTFKNTCQIQKLVQSCTCLSAGSLGERAAVRAKLGIDHDWQTQYFQKILPMLQTQDNLTLTRFENQGF